MYRSAVGMACTELYKAVSNIPTHGTWGYTNVSPIPVPYRTSIYRPYRTVHHGTMNLAKNNMIVFSISKVVHSRIQDSQSAIISVFPTLSERQVITSKPAYWFF